MASLHDISNGKNLAILYEDEAYLRYLERIENNDPFFAQYFASRNTDEESKEICKGLEEEYEVALLQEWYLLLYWACPLYFRCGLHSPVIYYESQLNTLNKLMTTYSLEEQNDLNLTDSPTLLIRNKDISLGSLLPVFITYIGLMMIISSNQNECMFDLWHILITYVWWYLCVNGTVLLLDVYLHRLILGTVFDKSIPHLNDCIAFLDKQLDGYLKIFSTIDQQLSQQANASLQTQSNTIGDTQSKNSTVLKASGNCGYDMNFVKNQQKYIFNQVLQPLILKLGCLRKMSGISLSSPDDDGQSSSQYEEIASSQNWSQICQDYKWARQTWFECMCRRLSKVYDSNGNHIWNKIYSYVNYYCYCYQLNYEMEQLNEWIYGHCITLKTQMGLTKFQQEMKLIHVSSTNAKQKSIDSVPFRWKWKFVDWRETNTDIKADSTDQINDNQKNSKKILDQLYRLQNRIDELNAQLYILYSQYKYDTSQQLQSQSQVTRCYNSYHSASNVSKIGPPPLFLGILNRIYAERDTLLELMDLRNDIAKRCKDEQQLRENLRIGSIGSKRKNIYENEEDEENEEGDMNALMKIKGKLTQQLLNHPEFALRQQAREKARALTQVNDEKERERQKEKEKWIDGEQLFESDLKYPIEDEEKNCDKNSENEWEDKIGFSSAVKYSLANELSKILHQRQLLRQDISQTNGGADLEVIESEPTAAEEKESDDDSDKELQMFQRSKMTRVPVNLWLGKAVTRPVIENNDMGDGDIIGEDDNEEENEDKDDENDIHAQQTTNNNKTDDSNTKIFAD
ncbi:timeless family protein [Reticulomyxa filosa]|uniref:Timeless family protein n=1 Tax=Reticulomyxa filosa TaxID=46433 RepID=X6NBJ0_RETFI|nr:timeless family protein [Reticulomyxa filosa]|eukprot:ETO23263.1 timeless family protein [Reticulomyxa filosa]